MSGRGNRLFSHRARRIFAGCLLVLVCSAYVVWQQAVAPTQLWPATANGDTSRVRLLLNWGANVNCQVDPDYHFLSGDQEGHDIYGAAYRRRYWTPLATAASSGNTRVVRLLLSRGADVNGQGLGFCGEGGDSFDMETPLNWAATQGHVDVVRLLLQRGASANTVQISDVMGEANVPLAHRLEVTRLLKQAGTGA